MIVVSNTSPIINLAAIGRFHLLETLLGRVFIPNAVYHEIAVVGAGEPGSDEVRENPNIIVKEVGQPIMVQLLMHDLDPGEAEAIALAIEMKADLLLIDERRGRRRALELIMTFMKRFSGQREKFEEW